MLASGRNARSFEKCRILSSCVVGAGCGPAQDRTPSNRRWVFRDHDRNPVGPARLPEIQKRPNCVDFCRVSSNWTAWLRQPAVQDFRAGMARPCQKQEPSNRRRGSGGHDRNPVAPARPLEIQDGQKASNFVELRRMDGRSTHSVPTIAGVLRNGLPTLGLRPVVSRTSSE